MAPEGPILTDLLVAWAALLGATVGSFLNVVIARVPAGISIVRPRSRCPRCGHAIAWYDNVPVLSWLLLRGRCRSCRERISFRYPLVEAAVAAAAVAALLRHGPSLAALAELALVALLLGLAFIDLDTWQLPHALTWPLIAIALLASMAGLGIAPAPSSAAGALVGFAAFGGIWLVGEKVLHRELMGLGDAFLLAGIGAWLGLAALLPVVLLASIQGSVVGVVQLALGKGTPGPSAPDPGNPVPADPGPGTPPGDTVPEVSPEVSGKDDDWVPPRHSVPFGPFLAAGALEWLYLAGWVTGGLPWLSVFR